MSKVVKNLILGAVTGLLCLWGPITPAQSGDLAVEEKIKALRSRYEKVERALKHCKQVKRDLPGESAEGGELTAYFSGQSLRKLVAKFYGETGQALEEYYFWDEHLFFVLRVESRYDKPLSGVIKRKSEERFYFADDALIRWLEPEKREVPAGPAFDDRGREWIGQARKYSALVRKEDR